MIAGQSTRPRGLLLVATVVMALAACGKKDDKTDEGKSTKPVANTWKQNALEVRRVFAELRRREEQYRVEHNAYLSTGKESERWPPVRSPGQTHGELTVPETWKKLRVSVGLTGAPAPKPEISGAKLINPSKLRCAYVVVAGKPHELAAVGEIARKRFGMTEVDKRSSSTGQMDRSIVKVPDQNWFYLLAECDGDGDPKRNAFWLLRSDLVNTFRIDRTH